MATTVRSVTLQSFNYFSRPQTGGIRNEPIKAPCAWVGSELMATPEAFTVTLDGTQVEEVKAAVRRVAESGKAPPTLTAADFKWPLLLPLLASIKEELLAGLGFKLVRGFPVEDWSDRERELFFVGWGMHLGICGAQDNDGAILGVVTDTGADPKVERQYKTRAAIDFHCDAADAVGLLCVHASESGGESMLVSSATAYNRFLEQHPKKVKTLYTPFLLDVRGTGGIHCVPIEPVRHGADGRVRTFWHSEYYRSCYGKAGAPAAMPKEQREAYEAYIAIIHDPSMAVRMTLRPGDVQMCSNHTIVHARAAYDDTAASKRKLLRLWLSMDEEGRSWSDAASKANHVALVASRFVRAKVFARLGLSW
mmetsp:Transcript_62797/g.177119  ORF Transcript_62797/g.177119 Transcript_62797/m.177119 type:complete len:365 (+) Transcript_62797:63-1157(+)|eukprot:CAMPEP_0179269550 /NCGR_PEP_ID=MMETSP0797-20121207/31014_1 /TAXON_ID=47934 /ORGANISM="Dinophysis acuminata, Strain DAEP01" /LENGTH=364 /DNA_ID=CAMNT_0020977867 /DNA_START=63 /DNA_END=1157 /DNA_ORIENTATION=+